MELTREQVIAYRVAAQGLHRRPATVGRLAILDIGVQDSGAESARLAFDARLPTSPRAGGVGPGRPLALVWSVRGAPHIHRRRDLDGLAGALWPLSAADAATRLDGAPTLKKASVDPLDGFTAATAAMREIVHRPTGKGDVSGAMTRRLPRPYARDCRACGTRHVFEMFMRLGALPAGLELEPDTAPPVLAPRTSAVIPTSADPEALRGLIVAYLRLLGPATQADVAGYLGARRADIAAAWPADLVEVSVEGRPAFLPSDAMRRARRSPAPDLVRLLGPFDPYLQARDRDLIVPDRSVHKTLWPILGRPGVVLADGEVVGTWRTRAASGRLAVTVDGFVPLRPSARRAIEAEAQRVAAVRGAADVAVTVKE